MFKNLVLLLLGLSATACVPELEVGCGGPTDCNSGQACVRGQCRSASGGEVGPADAAADGSGGQPPVADVRIFADVGSVDDARVNDGHAPERDRGGPDPDAHPKRDSGAVQGDAGPPDAAVPDLGPDECVNGMTEECPDGMDTGECVRGTRTCAEGQWSACVGTVGPSIETCDGRDNDCDGQTDEQRTCDLDEIVCPDGETRAPCNGCPAGTVVPNGWACIPAGSFDMSSPDNEEGRFDDEALHQQDIGQPYLMKTTEVTQGEWEAVMAINPSYFERCGNTCPVEQVNWYEAVAYLNALSSAEGLARCYADAQGNDYDVGDARARTTPVWRNGTTCRGYRLPTEAEWEKAARAGTATASYNGPVANVACVFDASLDPIAWYCGNANDTTHPVGGKNANAWGLYDMLGNVWEWCWDWYDLYPGAPAADYAGPEAGGLRVDRGGSWLSAARLVRAANRNGDVPAYQNNDVGFRPARSVIP